MIQHRVPIKLIIRLRTKEKMKMNNKIILSTVTALTLLLIGCTDGGDKAGGGDTGNTNPPVTENPGGPVTEIPVEPKIPVNQSKPGGWYGRTVVSTTAADGTVYTHSTAGIFGKTTCKAAGP